jgi:hypothetical protein
MNRKFESNLDKITPEQWDKMGINREQLEESMAKMQEREEHAPSVGDPAPDFVLKCLSETGKPTGEDVKLSNLRGKPVALIFGSYT